MKTILLIKHSKWRILALTVFFHAQITAQEVTLNLPSMTQHLDGVQTTEDISHRNDITTAAIRDAANVYYFTSEQAFETWAREASGGDAVIQRNTTLNDINKYVNAKGYQDIDGSNPLPADLEQHLNTLLPGAFQQDQSGGVPFCKYFDLPMLTGQSKFCVGQAWPSLGDFNGRADSAFGGGSGIVTFCSQTWFGGFKLHVFSFNHFIINDFGWFRNAIRSHTFL